MKTVVKSKHPLLSARHCKAHLDFTYAHKDWTVENWKKVVWSDETKVNHLGSDGRKWVWKKAGEGISDRLVEGTVIYVWRRFCDDVGVYDLGGRWICCQD